MKRRLVAPLASAVIVLAGCGELLDPAAGVVGDHKITTDEVTAALDLFTGTPEFDRLTEQGDPGEVRRQYEQGILSQLIRRELLRDEAQELGIEVSKQDVDEGLERIKSDFPSESEFQQAVQDQGLTSKRLREIVRDSLVEERLREAVTKGVEPDGAAIRASYEERTSEFTETRAAHILVDRAKLAQQIFTRLKEAPPKRVDALFRDLARRHSTDDSTASKGGDLGFAGPGTYIAEFEQALASLSVGEISKPVKTQFGFHVLRVLDQRIAPFEEVRAGIEEELTTELKDQAWQEWLVEKYRSSDIRVNPRYGELDPQTQRVVDPEAGDVPGTVEATPPPTPTPSPLEPLDQ